MAFPTVAKDAALIDLPFSCAFDAWLDQHSRYIKPNTIRSYVCCRKPLLSFFGEMITGEIRLDHIRRYQDERRTATGSLSGFRTAGNTKVNFELSTLQQILKEVGTWKIVGERYKPLRQPKSRAGHSLSVEEERHLREIAFSKPKWRLAAHCMTVMLSTTMGFGELRYVRRRDVDMEHRCVVVRDGAKNEHRDRTIPLNTAAYESMSWLIERWTKLGGRRDSEFILPHRPRTENGPWFFDEPMTAIRSAFKNIRKEAGLPHFRVYDCRVQAITKLLSNPAVSPQVSKEIAGHISQAMQDRYSIQQYDTKKAALDAMEAPDILAVSQVAVQPMMPHANELIGQLFRAMQVQYNITPEQMLTALRSQTAESCSARETVNVIAFRPRP
jgi:integrase